MSRGAVYYLPRPVSAALALASAPLLLAGNSILIAIHLYTWAVGEKVLCFGA